MMSNRNKLMGGSEDGSFCHPPREMIDVGPPPRKPRPHANSLPLPSTLPLVGLGEMKTIAELKPLIFGRACDLGSATALAHMDPPTPWITWITNSWIARLNQNLLHAATAPVARDLEKLVLEWLCPFFRMDGGWILPGSTLANLTALWAARELRGITGVVASKEAHVSVRKAANLLRLSYRESEMGEGIDREQTDSMKRHKEALVVTAGTTSTGSIEPLKTGCDFAWRHCDAAWAGPLRLSERYRERLSGIESFDSIAVSAHKLLFQPKECALLLLRESQPAEEALRFEAPYLSTSNCGLLGSHGASAINLLATLRSWGLEGIQSRIERCMGIADTLAELVKQSPDFELHKPPVTGVVLWRPRHTASEAVYAKLSPETVSLVTVGKETWLRSVAANPNADPVLIFRNIRRAAQLSNRPD